MAFKNVGTFDLGKAATRSAQGGNAAVFNMDAAGIASGQAFLSSELESATRWSVRPLQALPTAVTSPSASAADGRRLCPRCRWGMA